MTDPISAISFTAEMFSVAMDAYKLFRKALAFPDSAEKLVLRLKVEYVRLQLWGRNSGLDRGYLPLQFKTFEDVILDLLKRLTMLFQDSAKLREKYGLLPMDESSGGNFPKGFGTSKAQRSASFIRIKQAWKGVAKLDRSDISSTVASLDSSRMRIPGQSAGQADKTALSIKHRLQWAISSQSQFEELILEIRGFTDSLNDLLRESQQLTLSHDWEKVQIDMLTKVRDTESLRLVQAATEGYQECENIFDMATRKAIVVADTVTSEIASVGEQSSDSFIKQSHVDHPITVVRKADFFLPSSFHDVARCLARHKKSGEHPSSLVTLRGKEHILAALMLM